MGLKLLDGVALFIGLFGVLTIVWGSLKALVRYVWAEYRNLRNDQGDHTSRLRQSFGTDLLLGLEFLVAADILHTLIKPDIAGLIVLGSIVAIRTGLARPLPGTLKRDINFECPRFLSTCPEDGDFYFA